MSDLDRKLMDLAFQALEPNPNCVRRYPNALPADDAELRERLLHESRDEPQCRSWEDQAADDAGVRRWGEL